MTLGDGPKMLPIGVKGVFEHQSLKRREVVRWVVLRVSDTNDLY